MQKIPAVVGQGGCDGPGAESSAPSSHLGSHRSLLQDGKPPDLLGEGLIISSYVEANTVFKVFFKKRKIKLWKAPQLFCTSGKTQNFQLVGGGWDGKKIHSKMKGFALLPAAKICSTLSTLRGLQLPPSHLPHGKACEQ